MGPDFTNTRTSYESLAIKLRAFAFGKASYDFCELQGLLKSQGWTLEEYLQAYDQQLAINKLKGEV